MKSLHSRDTRTPSQRHGFVFFALLGAVFVALGIGTLRVLGLESDAPLNESPWWFVALFFTGLIINCIVSYYISLSASEVLYRWRSRLMSRLRGNR